MNVSFAKPRTAGLARQALNRNLARVNTPAGPPPVAPHSISIVVPTLNEAAELPETLRRARAIPEVGEIIVVDGGSRDDTRQVATEAGCAVLSAPAGRGGQLRLGASRARGELVLLLHADTWLPPEAGKAAFECCQRRDVVGGGFWKTFRNPSWLMRGSRARCWLRLWVGRRILGDQAMFIRREALERIGGVPDVPLMEDFELCRRLRPLGRLALADAVVSTSARRFQSRGVLRTYWRMWTVSLRYRFGATPEELRRLYEKE